MDSDRDPLRKIPTKHAPEIKADIGAGLKQARTKKGHSIDAVSQHTRIPRKFLDALENNRFEEFPALAYLRGFLKSYCDYLELDFDEIWRKVEAPAPAAPEPGKPAAQEPPHAPAPEPAHHEPQQHHKPAPHTAPAPHVAKSNGHPPAQHGHGAETSIWLPGLLILAGCALAGLGLYWLSARQQPPQPAEQAAPAIPGAIAPLKSTVQAQLTLQFQREMWVSIGVDGAEKFQGRVPQGTKQDWKADKTFSLRASDPQGLRLSLNGQPYQLGAPQADGSFRIEVP